MEVNREVNDEGKVGKENSIGPITHFPPSFYPEEERFWEQN